MFFGMMLSKVLRYLRKGMVKLFEFLWLWFFFFYFCELCGLFVFFWVGFGFNIVYCRLFVIGFFGMNMVDVWDMIYI